MSDKPVVLLVNPHPDDESLGAGGLLAAVHDAGGTAIVVTCTNGEHGFHDHSTIEDPEELIRVRVEEQTAAANELGFISEWLGYRDSGMAEAESNHHPESFHSADLDEATERLMDFIERYQPQVIVTQAENGMYGHPDHIKAHEVAVNAFKVAKRMGNPPQKLYYVTTAHSKIRAIGRVMKQAGMESPFNDMAEEHEIPVGMPDERVTLALEVGRWGDRKQEAIRKHDSQLGHREMWHDAPEELYSTFMSQEHYILAESRVATDPNERHPFSGIAGVEDVVDPLFTSEKPVESTGS
jgi:N-acetyl-1-D-myo-inositol-2-amino-2-deoxy-alpha-D-glucopyranoside deacetylase